MKYIHRKPFEIAINLRMIFYIIFCIWRIGGIVMKNLLRKSERRRLKMAEVLFDKNDWMTVAELSKIIGSSVRIIKYDLNIFKDSYDDFTIQTSKKGVRIHFHKDKSPRTLYTNILSQSIPFQLLETIFLNENYSTFELADLLFISPSTLYRMIEHINETAEPYDIRVETHPCRVIGNEEKIRHFYSQFFYEKYTFLDWSHYGDSEMIDNFLHFFIIYTKIDIDFASYGIFKVIATINYIRFKNNHFIKVNPSKINFDEIISDMSMHTEPFEYFEKIMGVEVNHHLITQIFQPFVEIGFSLNYERLLEKMEKYDQVATEVHYLNQFFDELSTNHHLPLPNKEEMILGMQNAVHLETSDPRNGHILYDRNKLFALDIQKNFPNFYRDLCEGLKKYRKICSLPNTEDGLNYLIYVAYSNWEGLTLNLQKKHDNIKVLIISNRHKAHSYMLKDFIEYEFSADLEIDVYQDVFLSEAVLEDLEYDFIVVNFPMPPLKTKNVICIENIPGVQDHSKIQQEIDEIKEKRTQALSMKNE